MQTSGLIVLALAACIGHLCVAGTRAAAPVVGSAGMTQAEHCIRGRTIRWTWTDGPTAGATHEHVFQTDGSLTWRVLSGSREGHTADEESYEAFVVSESVCAVSYLAASGHTLTVMLNMESSEMYGFASSAEQWFPGRGTFDVVR